MRRIRFAMAAIVAAVVAVMWLMAAGQPASAATHTQRSHQAAAKATATPAPVLTATTTGASTTSGGNPGVTSVGPLPATGAGGMSGTGSESFTRLPKTGGGGDGGTSILPSIVLALLGVALIIVGRSLRAGRR